MDIERFESNLYQQEKEEFMSDKCCHCMKYLNAETNECDNNWCESRWK